MLRFLLILVIIASSSISGIAQTNAVEFYKARVQQLKTIKTGAYEMTTAIKHPFKTDTLTFQGQGFFERQLINDSSFFKIHTNVSRFNTSHFYNKEKNTFHIVNHNNKLIEEWKDLPNNQLQTDKFIFGPIVLLDFFSQQQTWADSTWLEIDSISNAKVLCFLDKESVPTSEIRIANDLTKIYFNQNGLPFRVTNSMDWVDYGTNQYSNKEIHFLRLNIPPLLNIEETYAQRGYSYIDGLEQDKALDKKRDSLQIKLGATAPSWEATTYSGETIDLDSLSGKLIVLDFWYKGCFPCMQSMPLLNKLHDKYSNKGLTIIGINPYQSDATKMLPFLEQQEMKHPNIYSNTLPSLYGVFSYPTYVFLDQNLKVLRIQKGYSKEETSADFENWISNYLEKGNTNQ